ncbi:MAG: DUF4169 family protein [Hyphomicrobiales bacterium]|nr:DUF4169 family protein [Hyphomicrobiales bacterium]
MGEIVNLRRARKGKERQRKEAEAAANRVAFGVTKAAKEQTRAQTDLAERRLEAHRLVGRTDGESE